MSGAAQLLNALATAVARQDASTLAPLLDPATPAVAAAVAGAPPAWDPAPAARSVLRGGLAPEWAEVGSAVLASAAARAAGRGRDAYDALAEAVGPFLKLFRDDGDAWLVEPLRRLARGLRGAARAADAESGGGGASGGAKCLENCGTQLQKCFAASMQGAGNKAKKMAALDIVVTLFRVYFALNTLRLCKNLVAAVGSRQFPPFDAFPAAQRVTYKYFTGRLAIFDEAYADADADLSYALAHCPRSATANRARAAFFLVPVRLLRGALPSPRLLDGCGLADAYGPLVGAVRAGDVGGLDALLAARRWDHVRAGTFLLLEKLRPAAARRLLKKVAVLHARADPAKAAQLPLAKYAAALAAQGAPAGDDDVECLVATLVARRYVKGYVAHTHRVLVLSKVDPFPPLDTALADACKRHACDLQRCLKRHSFDAAKCRAVVDALKACCAVGGRMGVSVHCPASAAGWTNEARH